MQVLAIYAHVDENCPFRDNVSQKKENYNALSKIQCTKRHYINCTLTVVLNRH